LLQRHWLDVGRHLWPARRTQCRALRGADQKRRARVGGIMARSTAAKPTNRVVADLATERLAAYAVATRFDDLPAVAVERAKQCLIDAVACAIFGAQFPWSAMVLAEALSTGAGGPCRVPGVPGKTLHVPQAALVAGAFSHAFEYDNLRKPGAGVHAGATVALPALLMAQALNAGGKDLIAAIVAGVEVMFRLGAATLHSPEHVGFHAPGLTGPFGSAAACASLMRLSPRETAHAFGIAGSLAGGLLAFAQPGSGGMVKPRPLGRAAGPARSAPRLAPRGRVGRHRGAPRAARLRGAAHGDRGALWRAGGVLRGDRSNAADAGTRPRVRDRARLFQTLSLPRHRACAGAAPAQPDDDPWIR